MAHKTAATEIAEFEGLDEPLMAQLPTFELFFKTFGFKRVHGRVWGLLVLAGQPLSSREVSRELDLSVGRDDGREVFAAAVAPALALDFSPFTMTLGMRVGVNPYGRELYGPAALLMGMRLSI